MVCIYCFFVGISIIVIYYVVRNVWCSEIRSRTYRDCSLFFGIATPVLFEHQVGIEIHENALVKVVKYTMAFVFVFFCIFYGYVYIKDFRGEVLTDEELASCKFLIYSFGGGSFILTGISQFVGGYYDEECK